MKEEAVGFWNRALETLEVASLLLNKSKNNSASRAYYAAFYAVSALFALQRKFFKKHSSLAANVHQDLVKPGHWTNELGKAYSYLVRIREKGDYLILENVTDDEAEKALKYAKEIIHAVHESHPEIFSLNRV